MEPPTHSSPLVYDSHMHTPLCRHASGNVEDYAAVAVVRNLKGIVVTCHNPMPDYEPGIRMGMNELPEYLSRIDRAARAFAGKLEVLAGLECDYVPGLSWLGDHLRAQAAAADFHYLLGSVHCQMPPYRQAYAHLSPVEFQQIYFTHLADAAESGFFDALSHPDIIKNEYADTWDPHALLPAIRHALDRIAATGVAMELNTSGLLKPVAEMNPGPVILQEMARRKIPVVLGSDSHSPDRVGDHFTEGLTTLAQAGFTHITHFVGRKPRRLAIAEALNSLGAS